MNNHEMDLSHQRAPSGDATKFKAMTQLDAEKLLAHELEKLLHTSDPAEKQIVEKEFDGFRKIFSRFIRHVGDSVVWDNIQKLPEKAIRDYQSLAQPANNDAVRAMLNKLVVIKLNGGLGTSMGCKGPKSTIPVRNEFTFLDLTVQQIEYLNKTYQANVPLVLMNSFNTDDDTSKVLRKYTGFGVRIHTFMQSRYPRINKESLTPIPRSCSTDEDLEAWYPPGHGDFYQAFYNSGLLDELIADGREYCFISNIDNLGATVDLAILNLLLAHGVGDRPEFVMEVTDKTRADVKGGTLIQYDNKLRLLEIAQVPKVHVDDFKSVKTFKIFNTNNLWIKLGGIKRMVEEGNLDMEVIVNYKTLDNGLNVIQLETAVGAAMKNFDGGLGIIVPRSRFLPVKKSSDLLLVMSNLYNLKSGSLGMSPMRMFPSTPLIKLGTHFDKVRDFLRRFETIPDLLELDHLTVSGDVMFGRKVTLKVSICHSKTSALSHLYPIQKPLL
ncbi:unnamed protein product, partial [Darwinula stevensoni]